MLGSIEIKRNMGTNWIYQSYTSNLIGFLRKSIKLLETGYVLYTSSPALNYKNVTIFDFEQVNTG